ncbi:hypothetical protein C5C03_00485 [Clavibacter michiganensis]|nr:hypothetical protein C5C03_00485 [Clavibacter michiganensis]PPF99377.1 hypothetical protein C5C05_02285 [Clavibacter michiganensis]
MLHARRGAARAACSTSVRGQPAFAAASRYMHPFQDGFPPPSIVAGHRGCLHGDPDDAQLS